MKTMSDGLTTEQRNQIDQGNKVLFDAMRKDNAIISENNIIKYMELLGQDALFHKLVRELNNENK